MSETHEPSVGASQGVGGIVGGALHAGLGWNSLVEAAGSGIGRVRVMNAEGVMWQHPTIPLRMRMLLSFSFIRRCKLSCNGADLTAIRV